MTTHDEFLEAAYLSEHPLEDPALREHLARCGPCREKLQELLELSQGLDGLAAEEREDLAAAHRDERRDPRFEALLEEHRRRGPPGAAPRASWGATEGACDSSPWNSTASSPSSTRRA